MLGCPHAMSIRIRNSTNACVAGSWAALWCFVVLFAFMPLPAAATAAAVSVLEELSTLTCPQPPLGIHPITVQQGQTVGWLPLAGSAMQVRHGYSTNVGQFAGVVGFA